MVWLECQIMKAETTARRMLKSLLAEIDKLHAEHPEAGITVSRVCVRAGMNPSMASRWKAREIEPRLSSIERLQDALSELKAEAKVAL